MQCRRYYKKKLSRNMTMLTFAPQMPHKNIGKCIFSQSEQNACYSEAYSEHVKHLRWSILGKQLKVLNHRLFSQNIPSQMLGRVLNMPLLPDLIQPGEETNAIVGTIEIIQRQKDQVFWILLAVKCFFLIADHILQNIKRN